MFYCDDCAKKYGWSTPATYIHADRDIGECEVCGKKDVMCNYTPSKFLVSPSKKFKVKARFKITRSIIYQLDDIEIDLSDFEVDQIGNPDKMNKDTLKDLLNKLWYAGKINPENGYKYSDESDYYDDDEIEEIVEFEEVKPPKFVDPAQTSLLD